MTPEEAHNAEMRASLLHRRANRRQEKQTLLKAQERIEQIDAELVLIASDLKRYGHEEPEPT